MVKKNYIKFKWGEMEFGENEKAPKNAIFINWGEHLLLLLLFPRSVPSLIHTHTVKLTTWKEPASLDTHFYQYD